MIHEQDSFPCCYCRLSFECQEDLVSHVLFHYKDEGPLSPEEPVDYKPRATTPPVTSPDLGAENDLFFDEDAFLPISSPPLPDEVFHPEYVDKKPDLQRLPPPLLPASDFQSPNLLSLSSSSSSSSASSSSSTSSTSSLSKEVPAGDQKYQCTTCGKYFRYSHHFKAHKRIHEGEGHFACDQCGKIFSQTAHLIRHKRIHTGERPFSCDMCPKTFNQSSHLIRHKRVHTGERPFVCDLCNKTFSQSAHLIKHRRVHSGERPFPCEDCPKTFTQHANLMKHRRATHPESAVLLEQPHSLPPPPALHQIPEGLFSSFQNLPMNDEDFDDLDDDFSLCEDFKAASVPLSVESG